VQTAATGGPQLPGRPACPITAPVCVPMNVTEVGRKATGTRWPDPPGESDEAGTGAGATLAEFAAVVPLPVVGLLGAGRCGRLEATAPSTLRLAG